MKRSLYLNAVFTSLFLISCFAATTLAQPAAVKSALPNVTGTLNGTVVDPAGAVVPNATVAAKAESTVQVSKTNTDEHGHFSFLGLTPGKYSIEVSAQGFALANRSVQLTADRPEDISISLAIGDVIQAVVVDMGTSDSLAAQFAPMDGVLEARSARTEISAPFIQNFTSGVADFSELTAMAPGTFTVNSNGVGLGDGKTYFRGFKDGFARRDDRNSGRVAAGTA